MNSDDIYTRLITTLPSHVSVFVCSSDKLPNYLPKSGSAIIVNFDTSEHPGTHWCGIGIVNKEASVIDSLKVSPLPILISSWLNKFTTSQIINDNMLQNPNAPFCGVHAIYFLENLFLNHKTPAEIFGCYDKYDMKKNDLMVLKYFV